MGRMVETFYGPMPGCPDCGVVVLGGPHICEHGVTPALVVEFSFTATFADPDLYRQMFGEGFSAG